ncbi:cell division protein ZipA [Vreelandella sp. EE22]
MELREWLIILGLALVSLIVVDGVRRLQRQRRVPRLDRSVENLPKASIEELDDEAKEAEINWELPNGGARVVKPADYSGLGRKPKLERQDHPGPSKVLSDFRRSFSRATARSRNAVSGQGRFAYQSGYGEESAESTPASARTTVAASDAETPQRASSRAESRVESSVEKGPTDERREPSLFAEESPATQPAIEKAASSVEPRVEPEPVEATAPLAEEPVQEASAQNQKESAQEKSAPKAPGILDAQASDTQSAEPALSTGAADPLVTDPLHQAPHSSAQPQVAPAQGEDEPVLRAEPEDAVFAKTGESPRRRQLRLDTAGELDDDAVDEYRLVDFEGMGRSFKRRLIERRQERARKKAEKAERAKALARQKAERKALEAEQRREAKEAAEAEKARIAQEQARAREAEAARATTHYGDDELYSAEPSLSALRRQGSQPSRSDSADDHAFAEAATDEPAYEDSVVHAHPTLEKALRHDVSGARAKEALADASEMVVISVLSREPEGFDGSKLLELMMACGLRYSSSMGVFHRFETESADSELQFSMVNVVKPGTFPIEEMDEFVTPGITFLMPLPGALDSAAAFEAMVETAMVVVRHMGGELKDENRSVMTAQTIEFARQRVHEFERRHRLQRHTAR